MHSKPPANITTALRTVGQRGQQVYSITRDRITPLRWGVVPHLVPTSQVQGGVGGGLDPHVTAPCGFDGCAIARKRSGKMVLR